MRAIVPAQINLLFIRLLRAARKEKRKTNYYMDNRNAFDGGEGKNVSSLFSATVNFDKTTSTESP